MKNVADARAKTGRITGTLTGASTSSLWRKAVLAVAMIIGYYAFSVGMIVGLLVASYFMLMLSGFAGPAAIIPAMFTGAAAIAIFFSIFPRFDRFRPPGVRVRRESQPKLFEVISEVAKMTGQRVPDSVHVMPAINAWVTERGGFMGLGRRRYLGIGLPLFSLMTVSQLEAVLAHEFGHFYNGHMRLGPWVYRTRGAMIRTVQTAGSSAYSFWVNLVYIPYVEMYLRVTQSISREQEREADLLSGYVAGREPAIEGLQLIHIGEDIYEAYWNSAVQPVMGEGKRPQIMEGFRRFLANQHILDALGRKVRVRLKDDKTDKYDSHPALPERVDALKHMPDRATPRDDRNALALVNNAEDMERDFLKKVMGKKAKPLELVRWEDVRDQVYIPMWERTVADHADGLVGVTPESLPDIIRNLGHFTTVMVSKARRIQSLDDSAGWHERASVTIGSALALALRQAGWELCIAPGEPIVALRDGQEMRPFEVLGRLMSHNLTPEAWREQCSSAGIAGMDFSRLVGRKQVERTN
jgi:heat shock protein HtpX